MRVYFNNIGVVINTDFFGDNLRQGAVGNELKAYFDGVNNSDYMATLNFTRSDGTNVAGVIMDFDPSVSNCYKYKFSDPWFFAKAGQTTLTIFLRKQDGTIKAQGQVTFNIEKNDYVDDPLITASQYNSLVAKVVELDDEINQGRFPSYWDASTGESSVEPPESPYTYKRGDYFRISISGNKVPTGTQYVTGGTNYEESVIPVMHGDVFYFNGTSWEYQSGGVLDVKFLGASVVSAGVANITKELVLNALHPVGSIYISTTQDESTKDLNGKYGCPMANIGGTWERIYHQFLFAAGNRYSAGDTGGEENHILTIDEMPSHSHDGVVTNAGVTGNHAVHSESGEFVLLASGVDWGNMHINAYPKGGGQPHNNMPPYLVVYMWKRIA